MSQLDAVAVTAISAGVVTLVAFTDPKNALGYLLAFPIWIVAKDLGVIAGSVAGACALLFVVVFSTSQDVVFGPLGYLGCAAVFFGTAAAGASVIQGEGSGRSKVASSLLPVLTTRPEVTHRNEPLTRRELQILEMIATGAKNAQIAEQFVISQNTVKSHVSRILHKLPARNRTEAAFRYIELYGPPTTPDAPPETENGASSENGSITAASASRGTVWAFHGDDVLVLRLEDGRDLDVPLPGEIRDRVKLEAPAIAYFDQHDRTIGWYLPDEEIGVDLRHWAP